MLKASKEGNAVEIKRLIDRGVDIAYTEYSAVTLAVESGCLDSVKILTDQCRKIPLEGIEKACGSGSLEMVKYLLEKVKIGSKTIINKYPSQIFIPACESGNIETVKYLVSKGADVSACGVSAMACAARHCRIDILKYLVSLGADPDCKSKSAFDQACCWRRLKVIKYLIDAGVDISGKDIFSYDPVSVRYFLNLIEHEKKKVALYSSLNRGVINKDLIKFLMKRNMFLRLLHIK